MGAAPPLFFGPPSSSGPPAAAAYRHESWEEQAFAEDSSGLLGGCVWPPRSYSCSFCRREFRSAQALGGHMNVHRRDRATLKQSSGPAGESHPPGRYPPQTSTVAHAPNPNPNPNSGVEYYYTLVSPSYDPKLGGMDNRKSKGAGSTTTLGRRDRRVAADDDDDDVHVIGNKRRRRFDSDSVLPRKPAPEVLKLIGSSPVEELDLELRLGVDPPKVK